MSNFFYLTLANKLSPYNIYLYLKCFHLKLTKLAIVIKRALLFLIILNCSIAVGQNETNHWYFGDQAGLNFGNASLTVLSDGAMNTPAGCSTISDAQGNLMFYTNGNSVWNKNHQLMTNGTGLAGDPSNTQSSIIIPKPKDPNTYYIFTTREVQITSPTFVMPGLYYSEIKFSNTDPLGSVVMKNERLNPSTTERLTAIHHAPSNTIRVIAFGNLSGTPNSPKNTFFVYNVTENGVMRATITSPQETTSSSAGAMKISPNGQYIAIADYTGSYIYIYDFDNDTVSFNLNSIVNARLGLSTFVPYGIEFSQDSKILYFTVKNPPTNTSYLRKYIIESTEPFNEGLTVARSSNYDFGALQLASNGNIYMASYDQLDPLMPLGQIGVITDAESLESDSGFKPLEVNLNPGQSNRGLPNFIQSYFRNRIITENACVNVPLEFSVDAYARVDAVVWKFGDGNTSTLLEPNHKYNIAGEYTVKATITINGAQTELYKKVEAYALPSIDPNQRLMQCDIDNDGKSFFNLYTIDEKINNPNPDYKFSFYDSYPDALADLNSIENPEAFENDTNPQEIFVKIISPEGCETISNFYIETTFIELSGISDMYGCKISNQIPDNNEGSFDLEAKQNEIRAQFKIDITSTLTFYTSFKNAQTKIDPLPLNASIPTSTIWVRVDNPTSGCNGIGAILLFVNPELPLNIDDSYTICDPSLQSVISLDGNTANDRWEWKNSDNNVISTNRVFQLKAPGNYSVSVFKTQNGIECSRTKEFAVKGITEPVFDEVIAGDYEIFASINGDSLYQFSLDNIYFYGHDKSYTFFNVQPGIYTIYVRDVNNCEGPIEIEVSFIGFSKYFTPNGDGFNDIWKIDGVSSTFYNTAKIEIYDRYGKLLHTMDLEANESGWDGTFKGEILKSTDYWFTATLIDLNNETRIKSGHFSLIL